MLLFSGQSLFLFVFWIQVAQSQPAPVVLCVKSRIEVLPDLFNCWQIVIIGI